MKQDILECDVVIVGAGPAGLAAAVRLGQLASETHQSLTIYLLEKGATVGAHILSGTLLDPVALAALIPDWQERNPPDISPVTEEKLFYLTPNKALAIPTFGVLGHSGCYVVSLAALCRWLACQAESLGVQIFSQFPASKLNFDSQGCVAGVITGDKGRGRGDRPKPNFQPGVILQAKQTVLAEGARGYLTRRVVRHFNLDQTAQPARYALGIKELWHVPTQQHQAGLVWHTVGWPLGHHTHGGGFIYHQSQQKVAVGLMVDLNYQNTFLDPFQEFQRFKTHPRIRGVLAHGQRLEYGAKSLSKGGIQALPRLSFPGGVLLGDAAGLLDASRLKGVHAAMFSGMLAAEKIFAALLKSGSAACPEVTTYPEALPQTWLGQHLHRARNVEPGFAAGLWPGLVHTLIDQKLWRGAAPWTWNTRVANHDCLKAASQCSPIIYPKPDGCLTFDRASSLHVSGVHHEEDQPNHLIISRDSLGMEAHRKKYATPEQRYCPAGVYQLNPYNKLTELKIRSENCLHCKTCDIKDPTQEIMWTPPEGGGGPNYREM